MLFRSDFLASPEIENIFENSDFLVLLSQAQGDRHILAKQLGISPHQLSYVTIHRITSDDMEFMENFRQNIIHVIGNYSTAKESEEYEEKIKEKQEEMVALIAENAKTGSYTPEFDERYRTIAEEINALKEAQKTARNEKRMADSYEQRIQDIDHYLSTSTCQIPEFDNDLVRRLISTIKVESSEKLLIQFQSGIVMEQEIRYE